MKTSLIKNNNYISVYLYVNVYSELNLFITNTTKILKWRPIPLYCKTQSL